MSAKAELEDLINRVRQARPSTMQATQELIEEYFKEIGWSLLKDEWTNRMKAPERRAFVQKVYTKIKYERR